MRRYGGILEEPPLLSDRDERREVGSAGDVEPADEKPEGPLGGPRGRDCE